MGVGIPVKGVMAALILTVAVSHAFEAVFDPDYA